MSLQITNKSIASIVKHINLNSDGIFLPYIQRDFVWDEDKIYSLLDSLMRGYPMGTILVWETDRPVNYRLFEKDYNSKVLAYDFLVDENNNKILRQYVLDGQQRLQSLYIAMQGSYNGNILFFNLLSAPDRRYQFEFLNNANLQGDGWIKVPDFLSQDFKNANDVKRALKNNSVIPAICTDEELKLIIKNACNLYNVFRRLKNIPVQTLTNDIPLKDIAEIFARINSGGVVLDATDLAMATITSEWAEAGARFNELIAMIQDIGFSKPRDFILQACAAVLRGIAGNGAAVTKTFYGQIRKLI